VPLLFINQKRKKMKKGKAVMLAGALVISASISAQKAEGFKTFKTDSIINLDNVEIISTRAGKKTPIAYTNITAEELQKKNVGEDIPYLLSNSPSILTTSDAGAGIGYTSMRVRGTDGTRINVTVNGIPMNDAESHGLYFVNMPDFASSLKNVQIQRGAGTSTNGGSAFGASVNMQTESMKSEPSVEVNGSYGSFNTHKETVKMSSGLIKDHWTVDARYSNIGTDGYIDRASVDLNSYMFQAGYYGATTAIRFLTFNGWEETYHAWNYASKEEMKEFGRTYNSCGEYTDDEGNTKYYNNQTDNYNQANYQLLLTQQLGNHWNLHTSLFYTKGTGYYEEYKLRRSLEEYNLSPYIDDLGNEVTKSDLVRRKEMSNDYGGGLVSFDYKGESLHANFGGGINRYVGDHYGKVIKVRDTQVNVPAGNEYYNNQGRKTDINIYGKVEYQLTDALSLYSDLQYRTIDYKIDGANDNWDWNIGKMQELNINDSFHFFNPKFGFNIQPDANNRFYASFAVAQKEPTRNNYTDGLFSEKPQSERLNDYEFGYQYHNRTIMVGFNAYYMDYKDQLVLTGDLNEIGEAVAMNVPNSHRMGIELMGKWKVNKQWTLNANSTLSRSRIENYSETLYEDGWKNPITNYIGDVTNAFSPSFIGNIALSYENAGWYASLNNQYVSKQYLTNSEQEDLTIDPYNVANLEINYTFTPRFTKGITVGVTIYNLFDETYENNGWGSSSYTVIDGKKVRDNSYYGLAAQAGIHMMAHISMKF